MATQVTPQTPYPTVEAVLNRARAIANDSYRQGQGRILTDSAPFTVEYVNGALEELQDRLRNNASISLIKDNVILGPITAVTPDPSIQVGITYTGFFNGTQQVAAPVLPADLLSPLALWERQVGSGLPFVPMTQPTQGLPSCFQNSWLGMWEWRQDGIWFTGSTINEEIRIRYQTGLPIIANPQTFADTEIAILASVNALATLVVYQYARARGAAAAPTMAQDAEKFIRLILNRYTRQTQRIPYRRQPYSAESGNAAGGWGVNLPF